WTHRTALSEEARAWLKEVVEKTQRRERPILPGFFPLLIGNKAIYASHWGIHAVNVRTGEMEWNTPGTGGLDMLLAKQATPEKVEQARQWLDRYIKEKGALSVLFENSTVGTLSSDGTRVYYVDDVAAPPPPKFPGELRRVGPLEGNRLVALNL